MGSAPPKGGVLLFVSVNGALRLDLNEPFRPFLRGLNVGYESLLPDTVRLLKAWDIRADLPSLPSELLRLLSDFPVVL